MGGYAEQETMGGQLQHRAWISLKQLGELLGGQPQAAAVNERQGDGPERLLRAQQPRAGRGGERRRFWTGLGEHEPGKCRDSGQGRCRLVAATAALP